MNALVKKIKVNLTKSGYDTMTLLFNITHRGVKFPVGKKNRRKVGVFTDRLRKTIQCDFRSLLLPDYAKLRCTLMDFMQRLHRILCCYFFVSEI